MAGEISFSAKFDIANQNERVDNDQLICRSTVECDGGEVDLTITRGRGPANIFKLTFGEGCLIYHELRVSMSIAKERQQMTIGLAQNAIDDILRTALRPSRIGFHIDSDTGDTFVVYLFDEHAPFAVRLDQEQLQNAIQDLTSLTRRRAN